MISGVFGGDNKFPYSGGMGEPWIFFGISLRSSL